MSFEFVTADRIVFGVGSLAQVGPLTAGFGKHPLVVVGHQGANPEKLIALLNDQSLLQAVYEVNGEPTVESVMAGLHMAQAEHCDMVVAYGGGSVIDAGKAISAILTNPGEVLDYLEVIGKGRPLTRRAAPMVAIPTTAGTGSEVTRNAVLASPQHQFKASLRSPLMLPRLALIDPELTFSLPPAITASTGMDALTQVLEPFVSTRANPLTDGFCLEGIPRSARSLRVAYEQPGNAEAREDMAIASLLGGLALANAGLGAVHGFASPIGGMFPAPHGAVCARLLPAVQARNIKALVERDPDSPFLARYMQATRLILGNRDVTLEEGVLWLEHLTEDLQIPRLSEYGMTRNDLPAIVEKARQASSMKTNPVSLTDVEMLGILETAL